MEFRSKRRTVVVSLMLAAAGGAFLLWTADTDRLSALMAEVAELHGAGQYERALATAEQALHIAERRSLFQPAVTSHSLAWVAIEERALGRFAQAEADYLRAIELGKRSSTDPASAAEAQCALGDLYRERMDYAKAAPLVQSALEAMESYRNLSDHTLAACLCNAALVDQILGRGPDAEAKFRRAVGILEKSREPVPLELGTLYAYLGASALERRAYGEAEQHYLRSLATYRQRFPDENPYVAHALASLGTVYDPQGRYAEAEVLLRQSLDLTYRAGRRDHPDLARVLGALGGVLMDQGRLDEAEPLLRQATDIYRKVLGPNSPHVTGLQKSLDELYRRRAG
jgi:tetratricopeptide (TPR) repeat protein